MATDKQIAATRANAQHSTGATSEAGKEAVSQNATKHGLTGRFIFSSDEAREMYMQSYERLLGNLNATSMLEGELIEKMSQSLWRSRCAVDLQDECIDTLAFETDESVIAQTRKKLELYIRYQTSHDRAYQRYAAELRKVQAEMKKEEIGFVSQKRAEAKEERVQAQEIRRANTENRRREQHENAVQLQKARIEHQQLLNRKLAAEVFDAEQSKRRPAEQLLAA
jgi:hypothetical protein